VIPAPGKGLISYDFTFVDPVLPYYFLADRTNKAIDVFNTATNSFVMRAGVTPAGQSVFNGVVTNVAGENGPNGVITVRSREIWATDGNSYVKVLSMATGQLMTTIFTGGQFRVDGICYDPVHYIGFAVNNREPGPPYLTAISARTHGILGKIFFDGLSTQFGAIPPQAVSIEQCKFNPRDNMLYVVLPEICSTPQAGGVCPGQMVNGQSSPAPGAIVKINPLTLQVTLFKKIPTCADLTAFPALTQCDPSSTANNPPNPVVNPPICSAPAGIAIGPPLPGFATSVNGPLPGGTGGQIMIGCNGAAGNADPRRMELIISDGTAAGGSALSGTLLATIPYESGSDEIDYDPITNTYILPRGVNNSWSNAAVTNPNNTAFAGAPVCPSIAGYTVPYGGTGLQYGAALNGIYVGQPPALGASTTTPNTTGGNMAGPQVLGFVDAHTGAVGQADIVTGVFNCPDTVSPSVANPHGTNGHIAVDPVHQQIYVPINSTSSLTATNPITGVTTVTPGICGANGANDALGCIAVFHKVP
jgi:hypothetical protein